MTAEITEGQARAALQAFLSDKWSLRVPAQPTDPDMVLSAVIDEREQWRTAAKGLRTAWDALCRCVDEFEPEQPHACDERRSDLDDAVERVLAVPKIEES